MVEVSDSAREKLEEFLNNEGMESAFRVHLTYG